jgi:hypothetical protein
MPNLTHFVNLFDKVCAIKFVCADEMQGPGWTNRRVDFGRFIPTFCKVNELDFVPAAAQRKER